MTKVKVCIPDNLDAAVLRAINREVLFLLRVALLDQEGLDVTFVDSPDDAFEFDYSTFDFSYGKISFSQFVSQYLGFNYLTEFRYVVSAIPDEPTVIVCVNSLDRDVVINTLNSVVPGNVQVSLVLYPPQSDNYSATQFKDFTVYYKENVQS